MIWREKGKKKKKSLNPNLSFWLYKGNNKRHYFVCYFLCERRDGITCCKRKKRIYMQ